MTQGTEKSSIHFIINSPQLPQPALHFFTSCDTFVSQPQTLAHKTNMGLFKLRSTLVASVLFFLLGSSTQVATLTLGPRDVWTSETVPYCDQVDSNHPGVAVRDCNVAFYNLDFQGKNKALRSGGSSIESVSGTCRVVLSCPGVALATAGRMLTNGHRDGGFKRLQDICSKLGLTGQISIDGGCMVSTTAPAK